MQPEFSPNSVGPVVVPEAMLAAGADVLAGFDLTFFGVDWWAEKVFQAMLLADSNKNFHRLLYQWAKEMTRESRKARMFFFEKKEPKNFCYFRPEPDTGAGIRLRSKLAKIFWFFF